MAAGMGSRYGGLKQIDPVGGHGQLIIDYSIFDARRAGFETVVFIIKHEIEAPFKQAIGDRLSKVMDVRYAFQQLDDLPEGYTVPAGREKPWGTSHAILAARSVIDGPFAVINADDYYGPEAFRVIYDYLTAHPDKDGVYEYAMVGYKLENTVTENGHVARGVCETDADGYLASVTERTHIEKTAAGARYTEDGGATWHELPGSTIVSMNMWGFTPDYFRYSEEYFKEFLSANIDNPKAEYYIPLMVNKLITEGTATVEVLDTTAKWFGVTYAADRQGVVDKIRALVDAGEYPAKLF